MNRIKQLFCFCFKKKWVRDVLNACLYLLSLSFMIYIGHTREVKHKNLPDMKSTQENHGNTQDQTPYLDSVYFALRNSIFEKGSVE